MKRMVCVIGLLWLAPWTALAGSPLEAQLQDLLDTTLADNAMAPGISLWVQCPQAGLDWSGAAGLADFDSGEELTPQHTFRIASNTKTYVAVAILKLVEQGRLDLDASIACYLPAKWRRLLLDDGYILPAMTLRRVLSHTAGLNDHSSDDRYGAVIMADPQHAWTPDEQITRLVEWFDPVGPAGAQYTYSDDGYILLGRILETVTGQSLGRAVRELVGYEALGLPTTWWEVMEPAPEGAGPRAHQYIGEMDTFAWNPSLDLYGGGGIIADVRDMGLFIRQVVKGEALGDPLLRDMVGSGTASYRLGLICLNLDGRVALGHSGFWNTFAYHVPGMDLTVSGCILNHDAVKGTELADAVVKLVAEEMARP